MIFIIISKSLHFDLTEKALFQVILGLLLVCADWEKGGVCLRVCMCVCFMTENCWDMFFVVRLNDSFNFALGWIKYIVIVVIVTFPNRSVEPDVPETESQKEWCRLFSLKKKAEIEVPEAEGHDGCQRLMCQRRMVQTCVPETDGTDLCPWDGMYRPVSVRRMVQTCVRETNGTDLCPWDGWCRPVSLRRKARTGGRGCPRDWDFRDGRPRRACLSLKTYTDGADGCTSCINCDVVQWPCGPADRKIGTSIFQCNFGA